MSWLEMDEPRMHILSFDPSPHNKENEQHK